jgi:hypothetical protein
MNNPLITLPEAVQAIQKSATLGEAIDSLYQARAARLVKAKEVKELQVVEAQAKIEVLKLLEASGLQKASGKLATAGITTDDVPYIKDWDEVYAYIKANDRFDLIQKRIGVVAWRDLFNDGVLVPGTEAAIDTDISLTKSTRT